MLTASSPPNFFYAYQGKISPSNLHETREVVKYEMLCLPLTYHLCGKLTEATLILVPCLLQKNKEV